ncbi:MAG: organic solvent tolerance protein [Bdellovibrionales bacterium]|nr:organic solvent tolerance protein [Bdellovibrionales bacterium]
MKYILVVMSLLIFSPQIYAKDLVNRLGVGYSDPFSEVLPSLTVRYYPSLEMGYSAALAVDTEKNYSRFGFMVNLYRTIFMEDNMNFFMGGGAGLISKETAGVNSSGFEVSGFAGGEFFFSGLDSLGFSFESGLGVTSISDQVRFRTFLGLGITFYF